ncbi:radical SAM protein [Erythrobacter sp. JK5]|uniref:radical SAM protein n=1 Tax=Erythrobacter sp. JK5 TaxID=2829500 RepID=UPI001BAB2649|nr:radical SAM protein [Erythrobacter sp. JK5]QUL37957.1 radical SAM protein [Erythrobacter sp. JK5]
MRSVTININQTCPLKCRHCSLGFSDGDHSRGTALSPARLTEMIEAIDTASYQIALFAGGEPTLNADLIAVGAQAAAARGLIPAVVTAPIWARAERTAERLLSSIGPVRLLILSYDKYHLEFLKREDYLRAIRMAKARGFTPVLQVSAASEAEGRAAIEDMAPHLAREMINVMPVVGVGNALLEESLELSPPVNSPGDLEAIKRSCVAGNAFIDESGDLHGCCWASSVEDSPISIKGPVGDLARRFGALEGNEAFVRMVGGGFIDTLDEAQKARLAELARDRRFATECDLCLLAMSDTASGIFAAEAPVDA